MLKKNLQAIFLSVQVSRQVTVRWRTSVFASAIFWVKAGLIVGGGCCRQRTEFDLSFTEPYFLDRDVSAGFDLFHITRDYQDESSYDQRRTGGALRVGYPLSERWRQTLRYRVERNEITDVDNDASRFIRDQEGERDTSAFSQRLTYDSRDSTIFPTEGLLYWLDGEVAGLGGDAQYLSGKTGASYYYPVYDQVVVNLLGEVGAIEGYGDEDVQINERFFLGGTNLRGFEDAGVGPRDSSTNDSLVGSSSIVVLRSYHSRWACPMSLVFWGMRLVILDRLQIWMTLGRRFRMRTVFVSVSERGFRGDHHSGLFALTWRSLLWMKILMRKKTSALTSEPVFRPVRPIGFPL